MRKLSKRALEGGLHNEILPTVRSLQNPHYPLDSIHGNALLKTTQTCQSNKQYYIMFNIYKFDNCSEYSYWAYHGQICPSSVHSATPAEAWQIPAAQHTGGARREDELLEGWSYYALLSESLALHIPIVYWNFSLHFNISYLLSKQQISLRLWGLACRFPVVQANVRCLVDAFWLVWLFLFIGEAVTCPLRSPFSGNPCPTRPTDHDRGRTVCEEDVCVVLCLFWVAEQEAVAGAQGVKGGLWGRAALGLHCCGLRNRKKINITLLLNKGTETTNYSYKRLNNIYLKNCFLFESCSFSQFCLKKMMKPITQNGGHGLV